MGFYFTSTILLIFITTIDYVDAYNSSNQVNATLVPLNVSWPEARSRCFKKGGYLVSTKADITCKYLAGYPRKIWLEGHKVASWVKSEGCFTLGQIQGNISNTVESCLANCQTPHIGFNNYTHICFCLDQISYELPRINITCMNSKVLVHSNLFTLKVMEISANKQKDTASCIGVIVNCTENGPLQTTADCLSKHMVVCDKEDEKDGYDRTLSQNDALQYCFNGDILSNVTAICEKLSVGSTAWTAIKRLWRNSLPEEADEQSLSKVGKCSYVICHNDAYSTLNISEDCGSRLHGFACRTDIEATSVIHTTEEVDSRSSLKQLSTKNAVDSYIPPFPSTITKRFEILTTKAFSNHHTTEEYFLSSTVRSLQTNDTTNVTALEKEVTNVSHFPSSDKTIKKVPQTGLIIGVVAAVIIVVVGALLTVVYFFRRSRCNDEAPTYTSKVKNNNRNNNNIDLQKAQGIATANYELPWDSNENKINSLVLMEVVSSLHNGNLGTVNEIKDESENNLNIYAEVSKTKKIKSNTYDRDDIREGEYDILNQVLKKDDRDSSNDIVYDSTLGARKYDDAMYNTTDHRNLQANKDGNTNDLYS